MTRTHCRFVTINRTIFSLFRVVLIFFFLTDYEIEKYRLHQLFAMMEFAINSTIKYPKYQHKALLKQIRRIDELDGFEKCSQNNPNPTTDHKQVCLLLSKPIATCAWKPKRASQNGNCDCTDFISELVKNRKKTICSMMIMSYQHRVWITL